MRINGMPAPDCTEECGARVQCATCKRTKAPRGSSVPLPMAGGVCDSECPGYYDAPHPPHLWPSEVCRIFGHKWSDWRDRRAILDVWLRDCKRCHKGDWKS
jgi:hypothetical protein